MKTKISFKQVIQSACIGFGSIVILVIFGSIGKCSVDRHNRACQPNTTSYEVNSQLNKVEQYHRSVGHDIKFIEDILP